MTAKVSSNGWRLKNISSSKTGRVVHLPVYPENPYQPLIMEAQRELGWEVIDGGGGGTFLRTCLRQWKPDILHLHWLHPYLLRNYRLASWCRGLRFLTEIALIRRQGTKIAWTVHNLNNHNGRHPGIELALTRRFVRQCDLVFTHSQYASEAARTRFRIPGEFPVRTIRHPSYTSYYSNASSSGMLRNELGIKSNAFVVGFLGRVEPYKQVTELVQAFREAAGVDDFLLIGGKASKKEYSTEVSQSIAGDRRIYFPDTFVADDEVAKFMAACDLIACPSRGILTSGSVVLAMSCGKPVIAPRVGGAPEEVGETGFLYDPNDSDSLASTMRTAFALREKLPELGEIARCHTASNTPNRVASQILDEYEKVLQMCCSIA